MPNKITVVPMPSHRKADLLSRLRTIEGHVRGILRMVEADAYCPEVLTQALAVQRAIDRFSFELLEHHLESCFVAAIRSEKQEDREQALRELMTIFQSSAKLKTAKRPRIAEDNDGLCVRPCEATAGMSGWAGRRLEGR